MAKKTKQVVSLNALDRSYNTARANLVKAIRRAFPVGCRVQVSGDKFGTVHGYVWESPDSVYVIRDAGGMPVPFYALILKRVER